MKRTGIGYDEPHTPSKAEALQVGPISIQVARAVAAGEVQRGVLVCGSGVGASVAANKVNGVRAALCEDHFSARQGVEDDNMNIICFGGRTMGVAVAWDCTKNFLEAKFSGADRHLRRLAKVAQLESGTIARESDRKELQAVETE